MPLTFDGAKVTAFLADHGIDCGRQVEGVGWEEDGRMLAAEDMAAVALASGEATDRIQA